MLINNMYLILLVAKETKMFWAFGLLKLVVVAYLQTSFLSFTSLYHLLLCFALYKMNILPLSTFVDIGAN